MIQEAMFKFSTCDLGKSSCSSVQERGGQAGELFARRRRAVRRNK